MIMITHIKMIKILHLDIWSMLLSTSALYKLFKSLLWDVQRHTIVQTWSKRKISYHTLRAAFFYNLVWMQDVGYMLYLSVAWQLPSLYVYVPVNYLLPNMKMMRCWRNNFHFLAFGIAFFAFVFTTTGSNILLRLNKILLPVVVITKTKKPDIYFYIPVHK